MYKLREFNSQVLNFDKFCQYNTKNWSTAYIVGIPSRAQISLHALS